MIFTDRHRQALSSRGYRYLWAIQGNMASGDPARIECWAPEHDGPLVLVHLYSHAARARGFELYSAVSPSLDIATTLEDLDVARARYLGSDSDE